MSNLDAMELDGATLRGKVALVTGSSRGIGAAIALRLAAAGAHVAVHGRDPAAIAATRAGVERHGGRSIGIVADVTRWDDVERMRAEIEAGFGLVDVLVANAGGSVTAPGPLEDTTEAGWQAAIDANLLATFLTLKSFIPGMKAHGRGSIVTIASSAARSVQPGAPIPYAVAKAGIVALTQNLAAQLGPHGVRVNCIAPGTILTSRNAERIPDAQQRALAAALPLRRLGTPDDVANAALYLASGDAAWVTGAVLDVTGGAVMA